MVDIKELDLSISDRAAAGRAYQGPNRHEIFLITYFTLFVMDFCPAGLHTAVEMQVSKYLHLACLIP